MSLRHSPQLPTYRRSIVIPEYDRVGLDWEALPSPEGAWYGPSMFRLAVCAAYGRRGDVRYIECLDRRPGVFSAGDLLEVRDFLLQENRVIVAHNSKYDLDLLNGLLGDHEELGQSYALTGVKAQDTMGNFKWGRAARNTLSARCDRANRLGANIKTKLGSPDWRRVAQGYKDAWAEMYDYVVTDVECALGLEEFYRTWPNEVEIAIYEYQGRRGRRR